jgi:hypothetical protein
VPVEHVPFFAQSIEGETGNVEIALNKANGLFYIAEPIVTEEEPGDLTLSVDPTTPASGVYTQKPVRVTASHPGTADGVTISYSVNGGAAQTYAGNVELNTEGVNHVLFEASDGATAETTVVIDTTGPPITIVTPADGASYILGSTVLADYSCATDAVSCVGTVADGAAIHTSTVGVKEFSVTSTDALGNTSTKTHTYEVHWPFTGFFEPVENTPTLNLVTAGRAVPVKFNLGGNRGLSVLDSVDVVSIPCTSSSVNTVTETTSATTSSLKYDAAADQYIYTWKTQSSWAGTCRQLRLHLADGSTRVANFKFRS